MCLRMLTGSICCATSQTARGFIISLTFSSYVTGAQNYLRVCLVHDIETDRVIKNISSMLNKIGLYLELTRYKTYRGQFVLVNVQPAARVPPKALCRLCDSAPVLFNVYGNPLPT